MVVVCKLLVFNRNTQNHVTIQTNDYQTGIISLN